MTLHPNAEVQILGLQQDLLTCQLLYETNNTNNDHVGGDANH